MAERLKIKVIKNFKLHGFSLRSDACQVLVAQLLPINEEERDEWLEKIAEHIQKQALDSPVIGIEHIELAIKECVRTGLGENETVLNVISTFEVPHFEYNSERKKFIKQEFTSGNTPQLYAVPHAKARLYQDRYILLHQRTLRHELFTPPALGMAESEANQKWKLESVEFLLSSTGKRKEVIILGLLTQLREGVYFLEDPTGIIQLDMSETTFHTGLHCENCFVLAEGIYEEEIFHVSGMGFPPAESSATSRAYFGNVNTFGGPSQVSLKYSVELSKHERENEDAVLVFLSDVWLDSLKVMEKLRALFTGYADFPPVAFVFMGNFLSSQHGGQHAHMLKAKLKSLGDLICQFPEILEKSRFIFIPGPSDPASPNILPRLPLPKFVTQDLEQRLPAAIFATNPCRIQYCTQEIVVIREDLFTKMCRNTIHFPTSGDIPGHFSKTILCQAHLAPLPLSVCPVYWSFDASLQLYPLPNVVVVGDQGTSFTSKYMECQVMNPGSFPKNEFSFKIYIPSTQKIEDSQIPNEY